MRAPVRQRGFSYLLLLFAVAALGIASAATSLMWSTLAQTERERELLFIGGEFSRALQRYYDASPAEPKRYPATLQELLEDRRQQGVQRHLRKIYFDPMTRSQDWGLVISGGQIKAVYSRSEKIARISVLPPWVDATGDKISDALKAPSAGKSPASAKVKPAQAPVNEKPAELRHADWLFVPVATTSAASPESPEGSPAALPAEHLRSGENAKPAGAAPVQ